MQIALFSLPYDSARRGDRMGAGPLQLLKSGLAVRLEEEGHPSGSMLMVISIHRRPLAAVFWTVWRSPQ